MKIDKQIEPIVREAFGASVAGERDRFTAALERVAALEEEEARQSLKLALSVAASALRSIHHGPPDAEQLALLGVELADDAEDWSDDITSDRATAFLKSLAQGQPPAQEVGLLAELAFGGGGWLLSSFLPDGVAWTTFLDQILDRLERDPGQ